MRTASNIEVREPESSPIVEEQAIIDSGANQCTGGGSFRVIEMSQRLVSIEGWGKTAVENIKIGMAATVAFTSTGERVLLIGHEVAITNQKTLLSKCQMTRAGHRVDDTASRYGGGQQIIMADGTILPLRYRNGLHLLKTERPNDEDLEMLRAIELTRNEAYSPEETENDDASEPSWTNYIDPFINESLSFYNDYLEPSGPTANFAKIQEPVPRLVFTMGAAPQVTATKRQDPDYEHIRQCLLYKPMDRVMQTLKMTTQLAMNSQRLPLRQHFKSRIPALNARRLTEPYATDTFFSSIKSIEGYTCAQIYVGKSSAHTVVYGLSSEDQFPLTLYDFTRDVGVPVGLMSDNAKAETSAKVKEWLRTYQVKEMLTEPHHPNQNPAERRIQEIKATTNVIMDRTNTPEDLWYLCVEYVSYVLNRISHNVLNHKTPIEVAFGETPDISAILQFSWYEKLLYLDGAVPFPKSKEKYGHFVGIAHNQGDALTFYVLTDDTRQVIVRSVARRATDELNPNFRAMPTTDDPDGPDLEDDPASAMPDNIIVRGSSDISTTPTEPKNEDDDVREPLTIDPQDLIGTFIRYDINGVTYRAKVARRLQENKYLLELPDGAREEIVNYNDIINAINRKNSDNEADEGDRTWTFSNILNHRTNKENKTLEILIEWDNGEQTWEPLSMIAQDDPISCANYAKEHKLLNANGWKRFRRLAKTDKRYIRLCQRIRSINVANRKFTVKVKYGISIPRSSKEAIDFDKTAGNNLWTEAMKKELDKIRSYDTFKDVGTNKANVPEQYKPVRVHFVFDIKPTTLMRKARLVAGGHLTEDPADSVFSGIVNLRNLRITMTVAETTGLQIHNVDIGNAYLEAQTRERLFLYAGNEFGELEGHYLLVEKALYGLHSSGSRFAEHLADKLRELGWCPCKADQAIWMKRVDDHYEYITTYVDDLCIMSKDPVQIVSELQKFFKTIKNEGEIKYFLGADFNHREAPERVLVQGARTYIKRALETYQQIFNEVPRKQTVPMDPDASPELDESELLDQEGRANYLSLVGMLQWLVTIGRYDIMCAVMTMARYRVAPRKGHMELVKRIFGYLRAFSDLSIKFRTGIPDYERKISSKDEDIERKAWKAIYQDAAEEIPANTPEPLGAPMRLSLFVDANLNHDKVTGRACTGILTLLNQTPIDWYSKRQNTVESATYGSEFVAARIGSDQIVDLRYTLRMLGVPLDGPAWMFGDNLSVVISATIPASTLKKRHHFLSYHRVRESIAAGMMIFGHIAGKSNPSDVLTKYLSRAKAWPLLQPFLGWWHSPSETLTE